MFKALNEDNKIVKIMEYRSMDISTYDNHKRIL